MNSFGEALKTYRKSIGLTQEELAQKAGISRSNEANIERGNNFCTTKTIEKITNNLYVDVSYLSGSWIIYPRGMKVDVAEEYLSLLNGSKENKK